MTDKAAPVTPPADNEQAKPDQGLTIRRTVVWIASFVLALIGGVLILQVIVPAIWPNNGRIPLDAVIPISFLNIPLLPIIAIPMTILIMIWLDFFFRTRIVND